MDFDLADARRVLAALTPPLRPTRLRPFESQHCKVVEVAVEHGLPVVFKGFPDRWASWLRKGAFVSALACEAPIAPTPRWLVVDESRSRLPYVYGVMTRLEGDPMRRHFGRPEASVLYRRMGKALRELHGIRMPVFGYILGDGVAEPAASWVDYIAQAFETKFHDFQKYGGPPALAQRLRALLAASEIAVAGCREAVLCHNDFHPGNVLVAQGEGGNWRVSGLLDFENALAGDPLFDLAKALDFTGHEDADGRAPLLEGYGSLDRSDAEVAITAYRIFHKLELWNWFAMLGNDLAADGPQGLMADLEALAA
jgi:aminoglycoside phosphotransferase (APT) family kinase protein